MKYSDEAISCYGDEIYGKSMFDVFQFFSVYPDHLKSFCRRLVKKWEWDYVNEERFIQTVLDDAKLIEFIPKEEVLASYSGYFKEVGYDKIKMMKFDDHLDVCLKCPDTHIKKNQRLEFEITDEGGVSVGLNLSLRTDGSMISWWISGDETIKKSKNNEFFEISHQKDTISIKGKNIVIEPSLYSSSIITVNFEEYVSPLTKEQLTTYSPVLLSQIVVSSNLEIKEEQLMRIVEPLLTKYEHLFVFWIDYLKTYLNSTQISSEFLLRFMRKTYESYLESTTVLQDYFYLFKEFDIPPPFKSDSLDLGKGLSSDNRHQLTQNYQSEAINSIIEHYSKILQQSDPKEKDFDFNFVRKYFAKVHNKVPQEILSYHSDFTIALSEMKDKQQILEIMKGYIDDCRSRKMYEMIHYCDTFYNDESLISESLDYAEKSGGNTFPLRE